jgi:hypothetical protein
VKKRTKKWLLWGGFAGAVVFLIYRGRKKSAAPAVPGNTGIVPPHITKGTVNSPPIIAPEALPR